MPTQYPVSDTAAPHQLALMVRTALAVDEPLELRLFTNDLYPQRGTVLGDYVEATFSGYSRRVIDRSAWAAATIAADHVARITPSGGAQEYAPTSEGETVYGCLLVRPSAGVVAFALRFSTPHVVVTGEGFGVQPIVTLRTESYDSA